MATSPSKTEFGLPPETDELAAALQKPEARMSDECVPGHDALQALLAFSSLHDQIRQKRTREAQKSNGYGTLAAQPGSEQFVLYEVLQLVAERALALTGADGIAIALVQDAEIICRAATGPIAPEVGAKLDPRSGFSGACLRTAEIVRCDDAEKDDRVNLQASRKLNTRSMVAVPLRGRRSVIGLLEAFSTDAYGFNDSDVRSLTLLAELILGAMKPEEQEHFEATSPVSTLTPSPTANVAKIDPSWPGTSALQASGGQKSLQPTRTEPDFKGEDLKAEINVEPTTDFRVHGSIADRKTEVSLPSTAEQTQPVAPEQPKSVDPLPAFLKEILETPRPKQEAAPAESEPLSEESEEREPAIFSGYSEENSRPGLKVVIGLVAAAILAAAGFAWHLQSTARALSTSIPAASTVALPAAAVATQSPTPASQTVPTPVPTVVEPAPENVVPADENQRNVFPLVTGIRHWESVNATTVVIDLQDPVQYEVHRLSSPERIYFDLHDTVLAEGLSGKTIEIGNSLLLRIRVAQPVKGISRVVLETKDVSNFSVSLNQNPNRLSVEIRGEAPDKSAKTTADLSNPFSRTEQKLTSIPELLTKEDLQLRARVPQMRIVIDAGHGGWDLGAVGRKGLLEKNLVLDVAQRLERLLKTRLRSEVILTREDDTYIPLEKRTEIANQSQADLFVSVHANNSDLASARGVETYYTNFSVTTESSEIEKRENATADNAMPKTVPVKTEPGVMSIRERTDQSRKLAASIERALYGSLAPKNPGMRDRGVKEASFVVLTGTSMPAVLAEVSFVSSPTDEQNLQSPVYRQKIAEALYKGIGRYAVSSNHVKLASAPKHTLAQ